jgi:hypothetical protein
MTYTHYFGWMKNSFYMVQIEFGPVIRHMIMGFLKGPVREK